MADEVYASVVFGFCDIGQSKTPKFAVKGDSLAMRQLSQRMSNFTPIRLFVFYY